MNPITPRFGAIAPIVSANPKERPYAPQNGELVFRTSMTLGATEVEKLSNNSSSSGVCILKGVKAIKGQRNDATGFMVTRNNAAMEKGLSANAANPGCGELAKDTLALFQQHKTPDQLPVSTPILGAKSPIEEQEFVTVLSGTRPETVKKAVDPKDKDPDRVMTRILAGLMEADDSVLTRARAAHAVYEKASQNKPIGDMAPWYAMEAACGGKSTYAATRKEVEKLIAAQPKAFKSLPKAKLAALLDDRKAFNAAVFNAVLKDVERKQDLQMRETALKNPDRFRQFAAMINEMTTSHYRFDQKDLTYDPKTHSIGAPDDVTLVRGIDRVLIDYWESKDEKRMARIARKTMANLVNTRLKDYPKASKS